MVDLIKSEDECGCTIACIATVLGRSYQDVRKDFETDFTKEGLEPDVVKDYLIEQGCSIFYKEASSFIHNDFKREESLIPFAPIHILVVDIAFDADSTHMVVMDEKGKIYCPGGFTEDEILNCYAILGNMGIYKNWSE
jgi:hypothetical protein